MNIIGSAAHTVAKGAKYVATELMVSEVAQTAKEYLKSAKEGVQSAVQATAKSETAKAAMKAMSNLEYADEVVGATNATHAIKSGTEWSKAAVRRQYTVFAIPPRAPNTCTHVLLCRTF
jgi:selenocysteine lyase/cysteine desulfurase